MNRPRAFVLVSILWCAASAAAFASACGSGDDVTQAPIEAGASPVDATQTADGTTVSPAQDAGIDAADALVCPSYAPPPSGTYVFDLVPSTPVTSTLTLPKIGADASDLVLPQTVPSSFTGTVVYDEAGTGYTLTLTMLPGRAVLFHFVHSAAGIAVDHYEELVVCATAIADCPTTQATVSCPPANAGVNCVGKIVGQGFCDPGDDAGAGTFGISGHHYILATGDPVTLGNGQIANGYYYQDLRVLSGVYSGNEAVDWWLDPQSGMILKMEMTTNVNAPFLGLVAKFNQPPITFVLHSLTPNPVDAGTDAALDAPDGKG